MLNDLKAALARRRERARLRRRYVAALSLEDRLLRDMGLWRHEVVAELEALA